MTLPCERGGKGVYNYRSREEKSGTNKIFPTNQHLPGWEEKDAGLREKTKKKQSYYPFIQGGTHEIQNTQNYLRY